MPITIQHEWAATSGNHPDVRPYYCPLICDSHQQARDQYHSLVHAPANTGFTAQMASMAAKIDEADVTFWYRLTALAESSWRLVEEGSDPILLLDQARSELARTRVEQAGSHPGTAPAPDQTPTTTCRVSWCVTTAGADPNDPRTWGEPVEADGLTTLAAAQDMYLSMAAQLQGAKGLELPTHDISFWCSLQATATTQWVPEGSDLGPEPLLRALLDAAKQPPA